MITNPVRGDILIATQDFDDGGLRLRKNDICIFNNIVSNSLPVRFYEIFGKGYDLCHCGEWAATRQHFDFFMSKEYGRVRIENLGPVLNKNKFIPYDLIDYINMEKLGIKENKEINIDICVPLPSHTFLGNVIYNNENIAFVFRLCCKFDSKEIQPKEIINGLIDNINSTGIYLQLKKIIEKHTTEDTGENKGNLFLLFNDIGIVVNESEVIAKMVK